MGDRAYNYLVPVVPTRTGVPGRLSRLLVAALAALFGALLVGGGAAHAQSADLDSTTPEDGAELDAPPAQVVMQFDAPVGDSTVTMSCGGDPFVAPNVGETVRSADGQTLTAFLVRNVSSGTLTLQGDGAFSFVPAAGFAGPVTFTYEAGDGAARTARHDGVARSRVPRGGLLPPSRVPRGHTATAVVA